MTVLKPHTKYTVESAFSTKRRIIWVWAFYWTFLFPIKNTLFKISGKRITHSYKKFQTTNRNINLYFFLNLHTYISDIAFSTITSSYRRIHSSLMTHAVFNSCERKMQLNLSDPIITFCFASVSHLASACFSFSWYFSQNNIL